MKLSTAKEHRDFFQKNGWIEFEEFLSKETVELTCKAIDQVLAERLNSVPEQFKYLSADKLYMQGRDVWRASAALHKLTTQVRFAEIASELIEKRPLRLGYDQIITGPNHLLKESREPFARLLEQTASLEAISCITDVSCGLIFALDDMRPSSDKNSIVEEMTIFPKKAGNAVYFMPTLSINWSSLYAHPGQRFYLIVYSSAYARYILQPGDPHTHFLKKLGYIFNDKLNDRLHPIIYR